METLSVGMYVRTNKGIAKIIKIFANGDEPYDNVKYELDRYLEIYYDSQYVSDDYIVKASYNIIDILEVGDYVNGAKVVKVKTDDDGTKWVYTNNENAYGYKNDEIRNIVTREQFEQMSYKVGSKND